MNKKYRHNTRIILKYLWLNDKTVFTTKVIIVVMVHYNRFLDVSWIFFNHQQLNSFGVKILLVVHLIA